MINSEPVFYKEQNKKYWSEQKIFCEKYMDTCYTKSNNKEDRVASFDYEVFYFFRFCFGTTQGLGQMGFLLLIGRLFQCSV